MAPRTSCARHQKQVIATQIPRACFLWRKSGPQRCRLRRLPRVKQDVAAVKHSFTAAAPLPASVRRPLRGGAIPAADMARVSVLRGDKAETAAIGSERVWAIDSDQYAPGGTVPGGGPHRPRCREDPRPYNRSRCAFPLDSRTGARCPPGAGPNRRTGRTPRGTRPRSSGMVRPTCPPSPRSHRELRALTPHLADRADPERCAVRDRN
jgi:hypothetical protein